MAKGYTKAAVASRSSRGKGDCSKDGEIMCTEREEASARLLVGREGERKEKEYRKRQGPDSAV